MVLMFVIICDSDHDLCKLRRAAIILIYSSSYENGPCLRLDLNQYSVEYFILIWGFNQGYLIQFNFMVMFCDYIHT